MPMLLHRYFASHADTTLKEQRLLLAKPSSFNDPFEFIHQNVGEWTTEKMERYLRSPLVMKGLREQLRGETDENATRAIDSLLRKVASNPRLLAELFLKMKLPIPPADHNFCHKVADENLRLCCFSECDIDHDSEMLLWSHYADKHKGVRIEFVFEQIHSDVAYRVDKVTYSPHRVPLDYTEITSDSHFSDAVSAVSRTKSTAWKYEEEWRIIVFRRPETDELFASGEKCYFPFEPDLVRNIDFGINCPQTTIDAVRSIVESTYPHVTIRKAIRHPNLFSIAYVQL